MFDGNFRTQVDAAVKPIGQSIKRLGITADMITAAGIVMAVAAAVAIGAGALNLGLLFLVLTGIPDLIDGAVAKAWGTASQRGAFFDSVSDRLTDGLLFGGVTWYLAATDGRPVVVILPMACYVSASLVSYIRAKGDALGLDGSGGLVERAERFIMLAVGLLFPPLLLAVLALIVVLNMITAGQRFVKVWRQAAAPPKALSDRRSSRARRTGRTSGTRWAEQRSRRLETRATRSARRPRS
ncbi:MAG: CDP-alcohol phosphatidyltransferase family protein [Acidimicrobiia bacterium]|nr:CDP-alcohol phosphatidyltransferase family protein [Microthrixaceae bacterium]RTL09506.1 MAG: CDP-alcohol phosphatidyltransferase family protein [Acidimicrobiia bacterium]MCB9376571.1 CDP-alcohol phosphatidyltransferase family protein [Microthrixaceae bacterium]MCB9402178.1 CDP-alcohol phosphatidyltransferase family protein [Microthrixaceae bacterium]MCO5304611.1 CDP-alcohol phosphatidyltransferase family protein [Microthrixaceae bacterium]